MKLLLRVSARAIRAQALTGHRQVVPAWGCQQPRCSAALPSPLPPPITTEAPKLAKRKTMAELEGLTEAEQIEMQRRLFAEARARSMNLDAQAEANVQAAYASAYGAAPLQQPQAPMEDMGVPPGGEGQ
jgi:hypothetical protein